MCRTFIIATTTDRGKEHAAQFIWLRYKEKKWDGVDVSRRSLGEGGSRPSQMDESRRESVKPRV